MGLNSFKNYTMKNILIREVKGEDKSTHKSVVRDSLKWDRGNLFLDIAVPSQTKWEMQSHRTKLHANNEENSLR